MMFGVRTITGDYENVIQLKGMAKKLEVGYKSRINYKLGASRHLRQNPYFS